MKPGIYDNISFPEYLKIEAVSNSYLGRLDKCPASAKVPFVDTPALVLGRAVHTLVLEGEEAFNQRYIKGLDLEKKKNVDKETWAEFYLKHLDKEVLDMEAYQKVRDIRDAVYSHPMAKDLLKEGVSEQTIIWRDPETGLLCKCRPDLSPDPAKKALIDLKTTRDASPRAFTRSIIDYGYARQSRIYLDAVNYHGKGLKAGGSNKYDAFIFIAVETKAPYRVEIYMLDKEFLDYGLSEYQRLMQIEVECQENDFWPHYSSEGIETLVKPKYL
jgi:exodeoxyribonuclease VIII